MQENEIINENSNLECNNSFKRYSSATNNNNKQSPKKLNNDTQNTFFSWTILTEETATSSQIVLFLICIFFLGMLSSFIIHEISKPQSPNDETIRYGWVEPLSSTIGYTYTISWCLGPFPQLKLNSMRKNTTGLSIDGYMLNAFACLCYSIYSLAMYYNSTVQTLYEERHGGERNRVDGNDVVFAVYAFVMNTALVCQITYYGYENKKQQEKLNDGASRGWHETSQINTGIIPTKSTQVLLLSTFTGSIIYAMCIVIYTSYNLQNKSFYALSRYLNWLDFCYYLSSIKIIMVLLKYIPQALLNYQRKSTKGFSIFQTFLDVNGGILSMVQLILDSWNAGDWSGIVGDWAKFLLGFISVFFDVSLMS